MKKLTIADVAREAGVSKSTVSQFLNKRYHYMSEATKQKISEVIERLEYQPSGLARGLGLRENRTYMVGIIVANLNYTLSISCIRAIENELQSYGIAVIICNADESPEKEQKYIEMLKARQVDGLIIFPTSKSPTMYTKLIEQGYPVVFLDRLVDGIAMHSLLMDNEMACKIAIQEFVQHGHQKIAFLSLPIGKDGITPRKERLSGFKRAMENEGLAVHLDYIRDAAKEELGNTLAQLISLSTPPTAILASNDIVLAEILKYVNVHHLRIPQDISVIGIDHGDFAQIYNPCITTVCQPAYEMGVKAAQIIVSCIEQGQSVPITYRFPPQLIKGQSVLRIEN
ncbi:LacI family kdg operon repressor [Paenibacillus turicensis]|uniref:LacI family kdg operon repressor n=1 Tax=Paenibacillus turicensis TaxID=160487 RepID=A0ABS4FUJ4_9BACL|nr:LacI family DNA-binding transcriptional regulator [Paenibacillus turicensis]MBP1906244.1 LacI family kdg operon repressor [Paenibacillus turicensis]